MSVPRLTRRAFCASVAAAFAAQPVTAQTGFIATGRLTDGGENGTYAFGNELALIARPKSTAQRQLDALLNTDVEITVRPV